MSFCLKMAFNCRREGVHWPVVGKSGFRSPTVFADAVNVKYQSLYDQGYARVMNLVNRGIIRNDPMIIGSKTDAFARVGLRD